MPNQIEDKKRILLRVRRIKGQTQAIENALEENADCGAILQQICSVRGAINGLMNELIEEHLRHHVLAEATAVNETELEEFLKLLKRYG